MKLRLAILLSIFFSAFYSNAQTWNSSGANFTTGKLAVGTNTHGITGTGVNTLVIGDGVSSRGLVVNASANHDGILAFAKSGILVSRFIYKNPTDKLVYHRPGDPSIQGYGNLFTINNLGYVGIGTDSPSALLELKAFANKNAELHLNTTTNGKPSILRFQDAGTSTWGFLSNYPDDGKFSLYNYQNSSRTMVVDANGNLGLGTDTPKSRLDIASGIVGNANYNDLTIGNAIDNRGIQIFSGSDKHSGISFHDASLSSTSRTNYDGGIYYNHGANQFQIWANKAQRVLINSNGYVGIGESNPSAPLSIKGIDTSGEADIAINSASSVINLGQNKNGPHGLIFGDDGAEGLQLFYRSDPNALIVEKGNDGSNNEDLFSIDYDTEYSYFKGRVGIGTDSPDEKLHVNGTGTFTANIGVVTAGSHYSTGNHTLELQNDDQGDVVLSFHRAGYTNAFIKHPNVGGLILSGRGGYESDDLFISKDGLVGIGTKTPHSKLSVNGEIRATKVKVLADIAVPDYVFEEDYELRTLQETKNYIKENKHLPEIPSAKEIEKEGINLGNMNLRLLKKIEELTLYQIELLEKVESLQKEVNTLKKKVK